MSQKRQRRHKASGRVRQLTRRDFLRSTAGGAVGLTTLPYLVSASALGLEGAVIPSNRIVVASIGVNGMGTTDMKAIMSNDDAQLAAVCDVDKAHRDRAKGIVEEYYRQKGQNNYQCDSYRDFREVIGRKDIDAVTVGTPDHWHVPISIAAARAGKDIYCEKPVSRFVAEGRLLSDTMKQYGRVFQTGTQLRSLRNVRFACELVRNGRIGKLHTIRTYLPEGFKIDSQQVMPVPDGFDYDMWLGPALWAPYTKKRCHYTFRYLSDYAGGPMTDLGAHDNDIAQWGHGTQLSGPVSVEGKGEFPDDGLYDTVISFKVEYTYADGVKLICSTDPYPSGTGVRFEGDEGWVYTRIGIDAYPKSVLNSTIGPNEIHLYESVNHQRNFLDCVKSRKETICPAEVGHRSATICHIGNIAMLLGRKLNWDPQKEQFVNDEEANRMLSRAYRSPWVL